MKNDREIKEKLTLLETKEVRLRAELDKEFCEYTEAQLCEVCAEIEILKWVLS